MCVCLLCPPFFQEFEDFIMILTSIVFHCTVLYCRLNLYLHQSDVRTYVRTYVPVGCKVIFFKLLQSSVYYMVLLVQPSTVYYRTYWYRYFVYTNNLGYTYVRTVRRESFMILVYISWYDSIP